MPSYLTGSAALESNCLTSIFHQPSLKKARRARRTSPWRLGLGLGYVVCDPSRCLGSLGASFVNLFLFRSSVSSGLGGTISIQRNGEEEISPQPKQVSDQHVQRSILKVLSVCCFTLISHYCVNLTTNNDWILLSCCNTCGLNFWVPVKSSVLPWTWTFRPVTLFLNNIWSFWTQKSL